MGREETHTPAQPAQLMARIRNARLPMGQRRLSLAPRTPEAPGDSGGADSDNVLLQVMNGRLLSALIAQPCGGVEVTDYRRGTRMTAKNLKERHSCQILGLSYDVNLIINMCLKLSLAADSRRSQVA